MKRRTALKAIGGALAAPWIIGSEAREQVERFGERSRLRVGERGRFQVSSSPRAAS
jgi:hypothetical protein